MSPHSPEFDSARAEQNIRLILHRVDAYERARTRRNTVIGWLAPGLSLALLVLTFVAPITLVRHTGESTIQPAVQAEHLADVTTIFAEEFNGRL